MITINEKNMDLAKVVLRDSPKQIERAANAAINRTASMVRARSSKTIRNSYTAKAGIIKKAMSMKKGRLEAEVRAKGSPLILSAFSMNVRKRGPVRVEVKKGHSVESKDLFIQQSARSKYKGVMQRTTSRSYPLRIPYRLSVPRMFGSVATLEDLVPFAEEKLNERFLHEVQYRIGKGKR